MSIDDKADETKEMQLCPTKITGVRIAGMYDAISSCHCHTCVGLGIYLKEDTVKNCEFYEVLCRRYYK